MAKQSFFQEFVGIVSSKLRRLTLLIQNFHNFSCLLKGTLYFSLKLSVFSFQASVSLLNLYLWNGSFQQYFLVLNLYFLVLNSCKTKLCQLVQEIFQLKNEALYRQRLAMRHISHYKFMIWGSVYKNEIKWKIQNKPAL